MLRIWTLLYCRFNGQQTWKNLCNCLQREDIHFDLLQLLHLNPTLATIKRLPHSQTMAVTAVLPPFSLVVSRMLRSVRRYASRVAPTGSARTPPSFRMLLKRLSCRYFATPSPLCASKMPKNATCNDEGEG